MRNLLLTISYDGTRYHGWQVQKNSLSVQTVFQDALYKILEDKPDIKGCSRTDTGVHALEYAVSFKIEKDIPTARLKAALNRFLPYDVAVKDCMEVSEDFHARYSCKGKEYIYKIWNSEVKSPFLYGHALHYRYRNLDIEKLNRAASHFIGMHDFTAFCTLDSREQKNMQRTVYDAKFSREGDLVTFTVSADGFLYNMVRIMVGTLLEVAKGRIDENSIPEIINSKLRKNAGPTAPACGLYLNRVFY